MPMTINSNQTNSTPYHALHILKIKLSLTIISIKHHTLNSNLNNLVLIMVFKWSVRNLWILIYKSLHCYKLQLDAVWYQPLTNYNKKSKNTKRNNKHKNTVKNVMLNLWLHNGYKLRVKENINKHNVDNSNKLFTIKTIVMFMKKLL